MIETQAHWAQFYGARGAPELPSQFALFVANEVATGEIARPRTLIDVGCGNGRDSAFFWRQGYDVVGLDQSPQAIELCRARVAGPDGAPEENASFFCGAIEDRAVWEEAMAGRTQGPLLVYARFLLHAIDAATEGHLLAQVGGLLASHGGHFCLEARTVDDESRAKETAAHYRRFIDPAVLVERLGAVGLTVRWQAEGRGMAKYRQDDARVVRIVAAP